MSQTINDRIQNINAHIQALEHEKLALLHASTPMRGESVLLGGAMVLFLLLLIGACWP